jgi:glyoxylase-like metal-dependent hydrolase (beta-lactamase superfamily II)
VAHANLPAALANRVNSYTLSLRNLMGARAFLGSDFAMPDLLVQSSLDIDLGNRRLTLTAHPTAHTDNDLSILDQATNPLWLGDLLFMEHTPALDGSILGWNRVLADLGAQPFALAVPGHGPVSAKWPEAAAASATYLGTLTEETRKAIADGVSLSEAIRFLGESQRAEWLLFDEFNPRNATAAYTELEWE